MKSAIDQMLVVRGRWALRFLLNFDSRFIHGDVALRAAVILTSPHRVAVPSPIG